MLWRRKWQPAPVLLPGKSHRPMEKRGRLQSLGSPRVGHDWATSRSQTCSERGKTEASFLWDTLGKLGHWEVQYSCIPREKLQADGFPAGHIWCWAGGRIVVGCYFEFLFWLLAGWFYTSPENRSFSTSFQISLKWNLVMFCFWNCF